jgi:hypothetical protein
MTGRPKVLDDSKRAQLVAVVAAGFTVRDAARLVGCTRKTVGNEARRNRQFALELRRAKSQAQIHPLRMMQQAATTNWRAAAWWLERLAPETFAQPVEAALGRREANKFVADLIAIIDQAVASPVERERLTELLSAAMPSAMRRAWNYRQSRRKLDQAMAYFDGRQRHDKQSAGRPIDRYAGEAVERYNREPVERILAPDPKIERDIERLFASLAEPLDDRKQHN